MPLAALEELRCIMACPSCGAPLERTSYWRCTDARCKNHAGFGSAAGQPVLIDFEDSIADPTLLGYDTARQFGQNAHPAKGLALKIVAALLGTNRVAERHTARLRDALRQGDAKRLLIVGGASVGSGAADLYRDDLLEVIAFDIVPSKWTQFVADAHRIPLESNSVDAVWIQAVLEHVLNPQQVVAEIERVLRPSGLVYADTPFMQQVHMGPYDFTRFTDSGHRWLFRNFACIDSGIVSGPGAQLAWSIDYAARAVMRSNRAGTLFHLAALPLAYVIDRSASRHHAIDGACAVYFFGRKRSSQHLMPREIVTHYKGAQRRVMQHK